MDIETEPTAQGDVEESKPVDSQDKGETGEGGEHVEREQVEGEHVEREQVEGEHVEGEQVEGEQVEGEHIEGEHVEGEEAGGEQVTGEATETDVTERGEGEELMGEGLEEEEIKEEQEKEPEVEIIEEEEEAFVEEPPPDPAAPYDFSDSKELLRPPFQLQPDQLLEVEMLWEEFQNYTPAYTDLKDYITEKELVYMLKSLMLLPYTPEQLQELIEFCVRPPHPDGHITYDQFLKMVSLRQRDMQIEEELRSALQLLDPEKTGSIDREYFKDVLSDLGYKMPPKRLDFLIKEVDISNDGTIGIEDVIGTMCVDLNPEDLIMLRNQLYGGGPVVPMDDED